MMTTSFPTLFPDVTGVILAGGRSSRMGRDKARLEIDGQPLFERALSIMAPLFPRVIIAGDRPDLATPQVPCVPDTYPGSALGGLYTGLAAADTPWVFVIPCDMPFATQELVEAVISKRSGFDVVLPRTAGGLDPLFAGYHRNCLAPMRRLLDRGRYRVYDFYDEVRVRYVEADELPSGWERGLLNVNTPADLLALGLPPGGRE